MYKVELLPSTPRRQEKYIPLHELNNMLNNGMDVFAHYYPMHTGKMIDRTGGKVISPFPRDGKLETDPSFSIFLHSRKGTVFFRDHGLDKVGTHWQFVMDLYGIDFQEAVAKVKLELLGIAEDGRKQIVARPVSYKKVETKNAKVEIIPGYRDWTKRDLDWFKEAGISRSTLEYFKVAPATHYDYAKEDKTFRIVEKENSPMYVIDFVNGRRKIYQPFDQKFKWTSNTIADEDVFGFHTVPKEVEHLFLIGGNRDTMSFFENIGYPCMALASESANMPEQLLQFFKRQAKNIWVLYDNDKQGYRKAEMFNETYKFGSLNHLYQEFNGSTPEGKANDFVDMYQSNSDAISRFTFLLERHISNLYIAS